jgi:hypothetical protein
MDAVPNQSLIDAEAAEEDRKASSSKSNVIDILMA